MKRKKSQTEKDAEGSDRERPRKANKHNVNEEVGVKRKKSQTEKDAEGSDRERPRKATAPRSLWKVRSNLGGSYASLYIYIYIIYIMD